MEEITVWHNPRCSTSRGVCSLLADRGIEPRVRRYLDEPPTRAELEELLDLLGVDDPREVVRDTEHLYRELDLADADRDEVLDAIATHPILLQRPLVVRGERAVIGRPPERVAELLDG